ncbi:unnamed protein product [Candidula unifasciata]|uniref:Uncharacterized protein n=1 Tax=Candidula unifasciata TaxID=100452 RepID=A0A8S3ZF34_9EUPU|nr:unnamed protein product [Candidula unifasciata]
MLGLCWTPATAQGMQKMATTMPSNPEQLLGAILVRKDIFHRFETTMHDTCLDANNLLEYLFSLYNSTAAPAERENLPTPQTLALMRRDAEIKKGMERGQHVFLNPSHSGNPQMLQPNIQSRSSDQKLHVPVAADGQRKKIKVEQPMFHAGLNSTGHQHQNYNQPIVVKSFDNRSAFPAASNNQIHNIKMEVTSSMEPHRSQSSSCLPPFSQICRQGNRPYSPASAQYSNSHHIPPHQDEPQRLGHDPAVNNVKTEIEGVQPGVSARHQAQDMQNSSNHIKKQRLKGYYTDGSVTVERVSRKKKHPCFCGALFTRADNLKRHIRKCHEEKLEKLKVSGQDGEDNTGMGPPVADSFSQVFPSSSQDCIEASQAQSSESPQQHTSQQHTSQQYLQQDGSHNMLVTSAVKVTPAVRWSCFCGESFDNHRLLVEHTRAHDNNT